MNELRDCMSQVQPGLSNQPDALANCITLLSSKLNYFCQLGLSIRQLPKVFMFN